MISKTSEQNWTHLSITMHSREKASAAPVFAISRLRMGTDGPGITTLVTFMSCPLRCKYCLNKKCHEPIHETGSNSLRKGIMMLTPQELYNLVKVDNIYFQSTGGGICFGGGEPTLYKEFITEFKRLCGDRWKITLETSLRCPHDTIQELSSVVDHWIIDVKSMNPAIYKKYTGVESSILQNLEYIQPLVPQERITIKVPVIPGLNDGENLNGDIDEIRQRFGFTRITRIEYRKL